MDFTHSAYKHLLTTLQIQGYAFQSFEDFLQRSPLKAIVLRHDIDKLPTNALHMSRLENELGIQASYFFRVLPGVWDVAIMEQIVVLGHELGYHYEDLSLCRGNYELAIKNFELNLKKFREFYPVKTICMHGSPLSKYDNKKIWEKYDYRDYGIIADPSFDIDYNEVFYITDTGRSWNNSNASVRDKVNARFDIKIKDTHHLIKKIQNNEFPDKIMINVHPQRWNDKFIPWFWELISQNAKNVIKKQINRMRK